MVFLLIFRLFLLHHQSINYYKNKIFFVLVLVYLILIKWDYSVLLLFCIYSCFLLNFLNPNTFHINRRTNTRRTSVKSTIIISKNGVAISSPGMLSFSNFSRTSFSASTRCAPGIRGVAASYNHVTLNHQSQSIAGI